MDTPSPDPVSPSPPTQDDLRLQRAILGRLAAFGRFAFPLREPKIPRHATTWREVGPHASARECERRARQAARKADKDARRLAPIPVLVPVFDPSDG